MRRGWIITGILLVTIAAAAVYQYVGHRQKFNFSGSRLMVDLAQPDALIRSNSLSNLPRDLLKLPIARDVLTEDLAFYYEQNEDRLGLTGAIKRIAYEHKLNLPDHILFSVFNEPAEVALWRDGKGALRHYAIVMHRSALVSVLQQAATLQDAQLKPAGKIDIRGTDATILALQINPRRTLLLISRGERIVVLSDPGLLFNKDNKLVPTAVTAIVNWLEEDNTLSRQFALDSIISNPAITQTLVFGAPTLALGYGAFMPEFKGLRFDFGSSWQTSLWLDGRVNPGNAVLWYAAPANPAACLMLPVDWPSVQKTIALPDKKPPLIPVELNGSVLVCWYNESNLYSPVFIAKGSHPISHAALQSLANWAIKSGTAKDQGSMVWRSDNKSAVGASGEYVVFSPDGALVDKVLDTIAHRFPGVSDQLSTSAATLALISPRPLSEMTEREVMAALAAPEDANLLAAAQTHLPARMQALATYPPYRLELTKPPVPGWQSVNWITQSSSLREFHVQ